VTAGGVPKNASLEECERDHILRTLNETRWLVGGPNGAATRLGVKRTTLIWKMKKLGISRKRSSSKSVSSQQQLVL
jgi:formate hydrogenlyase transcriptional activator